MSCPCNSTELIKLHENVGYSLLLIWPINWVPAVHPSVPLSCVGAVDVGAGNEAAHFSPEGWNVPTGNRG